MPTAPTITVANNDDGTATVTISGGDAGSTNTVYIVAIDSNWTGALSWVSGGSRLGNGTVEVTPAANGVWFFYVEADDGAGTAISNVYQSPVSSGVESVWNQILDAVQARVIAAGTGITSSRIRILTNLDPEEVKEIVDSTGGILIAPAGGETYREGDCDTDDLEYPVVVAACVAGNRDADNRTLRETWMLIRETIRKKLLNQPLTTPNANIFGCSLRQAPAVDRAAWNQMGLISPVSLTFWSNEQRG